MVRRGVGLRPWGLVDRNVSLGAAVLEEDELH